MDIGLVEQNLKGLVANFSDETFVYDLLAAYGVPKSTRTRLQKGSLNLSKRTDEVIWKKNLLFRVASKEELHSLTEHLVESDDCKRHQTRFVVVTDFATLLSYDTKMAETLDIDITDLAKHLDFFLPWAGHEKHTHDNESQADIKAAYRLGRLYDQLLNENSLSTAAEKHDLNVFLARLLFCYFAEDTEIFPQKGMFTNAIGSHTNENGSDVGVYLDRLFRVMSVEERSGKNAAFIEAFPHVNGGLFNQIHEAPKFSKLSRNLLIECGELDWSQINPDIFGSVMQSVMDQKSRNSSAMHYTSVSNILKVIRPLFLDELRANFDAAFNSAKQLKELLNRIYAIRIFDPACGSGNFLVISYKELRKLEMEIYERLREIDIRGALYLPRLTLENFFGIEIEDFPRELALLSLWLAQHQMNIQFKEVFGQVTPPLPLKDAGRIVCANAAEIDWETVCPKFLDRETYLLGNPPYIGSSNQNAKQKEDMEKVFAGEDNFKNLDYIACWFFKGAKYIQNTVSKLGFVTTNSLCQGEQVEMLWPKIFERGVEIGFAYRPFKWANHAKHNAGVTVIIIGLQNNSTKKKQLFYPRYVRLIDNIGPYLIPGRNTVVKKRSKPFNVLPEMLYGSKPVDDGNLFLTKDEYSQIVEKYPKAKRFLKKAMGSHEYISGEFRWCIWVKAEDAAEASEIPEFKERFARVREFREASIKPATKKDAAHSYRFGEPRFSRNNSILVPRHSSERRDYLPFGFVNKDVVILDSAQAIYDPEPWAFGVISSRMHSVWVRAVAGRIRTDIRYSSSLCYNPFPIPNLSDKQKDTISGHVFNVLAEREKHPEKTIADLNDPELMPKGLLQAHQDLDAAVERCYRDKPFADDEERLEYLFELYEEMLTRSDKQKVSAQ